MISVFRTKKENLEDKSKPENMFDFGYLLFTAIVHGMHNNLSTISSPIMIEGSKAEARLPVGWC